MSQLPEFDARDPNHPEFWDERFGQGFKPWDRGSVPDDLRECANALHPRQHCLIPGCGEGYEVAYLADLGWQVQGIDFSPAAIQVARSRFPQHADLFVEADFFSHSTAQPLTCIYERAFLCALPPARREQIAGRWAELLPQDGLLIGFFYFGATRRGPPFAIEPEEQERLLTPYFERIADQPVTDSIAVFSGQERWQIWRRTAKKAI